MCPRTKPNVCKRCKVNPNCKISWFRPALEELNPKGDPRVWHPDAIAANVKNHRSIRELAISKLRESFMGHEARGPVA